MKRSFTYGIIALFAAIAVFFILPKYFSNFPFRFFNLFSPAAVFAPADLNQDGIVNSIDFSIMNGKWLTNDAIADLNQDGTVNSLDFSILNQNWLMTVSSPPAPPLPVASLPMCTALPALPASAVTYYIAGNEPGASNTSCDGLSPTNQGGGRCPFKDFSTQRVREKLYLTSSGNFGTKSVTVKLRTGTYFIHPLLLFPGEPLQPLLINATGQTAAESVVLTNYNGEVATIDGTCPINLATCNYADAPGKIWAILEMYGSNVIVQGLTFNNAYARNIQIGSTDTHIRCNKLIGSYGSDSDSIKAASDLGPVYIYGNDFSGPNEQAIDGTKAHDWIVENNTVRDGGGFGFKFEARNVVVRNNRFTNLKLDKPVIALGADGSSDHPADYEAYDILVEGNIFDGINYAVGIGHCLNCSFNNNSITRAQIGIHFGEEHPDPDGCRNGLGCLTSTNVKIFNNRFREIIYPTAASDFFINAESDRILTLQAGNNLYCLTAGGQPAFWRGGAFPQDLMNLATWQQRTGTDQGSQVLASVDPKCTNW